MSLAYHLPDPDSIPSESALVGDYARRAIELGVHGPLPIEHCAYGPDRGQRLDVYAPAGARNRPILLFLHGGAWINGHLGWLRFMAEPVLSRGFILVAATYRLAPRCRWPAQIEDAAAALAFVAAHAAKWGGDAGRIIVGGHSAGGHLAALASLREDLPRPLACFPVSAPLSLQHDSAPADSDRARVYRYLLNRREEAAAASPLQYADSARVPFHLLWGQCDFEHIVESNTEMVARLARAGKPVSHTVLSKASHFETHLSLGDASSPWFDLLDAAFSATG